MLCLASSSRTSRLRPLRSSFTVLKRTVDLIYTRSHRTFSAFGCGWQPAWWPRSGVRFTVSTTPNVKPSMTRIHRWCMASRKCSPKALSCIAPNRAIKRPWISTATAFQMTGSNATSIQSIRGKVLVWCWWLTSSCSDLSVRPFGPRKWCGFHFTPQGSSTASDTTGVIATTRFTTPAPISHQLPSGLVVRSYTITIMLSRHQHDSRWSGMSLTWAGSTSGCSRPSALLR